MVLLALGVLGEGGGAGWEEGWGWGALESAGSLDARAELALNPSPGTTLTPQMGCGEQSRHRGGFCSSAGGTDSFAIKRRTAGRTRPGWRLTDPVTLQGSRLPPPLPSNLHPSRYLTRKSRRVTRFVFITY